MSESITRKDLQNARELLDGAPTPTAFLCDGLLHRRITNGLKNYTKGDVVKDKSGEPIGVAVKDSTWRDNYIYVSSVFNMQGD